VRFTVVEDLEVLENSEEDGRLTMISTRASFPSLVTQTRDTVAAVFVALFTAVVALSLLSRTLRRSIPSVVTLRGEGYCCCCCGAVTFQDEDGCLSGDSVSCFEDLSG
jgi:hypothetical protein